MRPTIHAAVVLRLSNMLCGSRAPSALLSIVVCTLYSAVGLAADSVENSRDGSAKTETPSGSREELLREFDRWLEQDKKSRRVLGKTAELEALPEGLDRKAAEKAEKALVAAHERMVRKKRAAEMKARRLTLGKYEMPFFYKVFGSKPRAGRSLYISMHGGGGAPKGVNDRQWENQKKLYEPEEGVYLAPRAPSDTWNLWHRSHIDRFYDRLIENLVVFEDVDPDRIYILGYSAGGDGVYQLAPRMADRWAAAAMMAGHPNETQPLGLRNIGFTLHMGGDDGAYNRNKVAKQWKEKLAALRADDPDGYVHDVQIHAGKGHWMDREDRVALPWMAKFRRDPLPQKIVWFQDDVTHERFYWLALPPGSAKKGQHIVATRKGQTLRIERAEKCGRLLIRLSDAMVDLDKEVVIEAASGEVFRGKVSRSLETLKQTLAERGDPRSMFAAEIEVDLTK